MNSLKFKGTTKDRLDRIEKILEYLVMKEEITEKIRETFHDKPIEDITKAGSYIGSRNNLIRRLSTLRNEVMGFFPVTVSKKK